MGICNLFSGRREAKSLKLSGSRMMRRMIVLKFRYLKIRIRRMLNPHTFARRPLLLRNNGLHDLSKVLGFRLMIVR